MEEGKWSIIIRMVKGVRGKQSPLSGPQFDQKTLYTPLIFHALTFYSSFWVLQVKFFLTLHIFILYRW